MIQETKLRPDNNTPRIEGYVSFRSDRKSQGGGGLLTYIKDSLVFLKKTDGIENGTEIQVFDVKLGKNKWVNFTNCYIPPQSSEGQCTSITTKNIIVSSTAFIAGDFNAHSPLWDPVQPEDNRGEELTSWLIDNDLNILNDGAPTRTSRVTGADSSPDITLCGSFWSSRYEWSVGEDIGGSDHYPITTTLHTQVRIHPAPITGARWKRNADWTKFGEECEKAMLNLPTKPHLKAQIVRFNNILKKVATEHVGKTKPGKRTKCWMTPTVRASIRKRNQLRKSVRTQRREWIEACRETHDLTREAKQECWKDLLQDAVNEGQDESKLWNVIRSLNGTPDSNAPNEALKVKGKLITTARRKANAFMHHYASVSRTKMSKQDRDVNRKLKKRLETPSTGAPSGALFTMGDLNRVLKKIRKKGAAGPDDIPPTFLVALGPIARAELLSILNRSFNDADCPQIWLEAIIIPLLKAGKKASELSSYRPISLTSCVVKLLERLVAERLYELAELNGWFSKLQAGFRKGRGCEDQIIRLVQAVDDAFNAKPMNRSVMVLLDFSKAYDTVWRQLLLNSMLDKGVPADMVRWLYSFLQNRRARVRFNNTTGSSLILQQGLPQGSVLAPILFLFYINDLAELLPQSTINTLFADDVTVLASSPDIKTAERNAQLTVDIVAEWSKRWKIALNSEKSTSAFFTTSTREAKYQPSISIDGTIIPFSENPRLLGVLLDRSLSFTVHTDEVVRRATSKTRILAALAHTEWGWRKQQLKKVFFAHVRSVLDYAAAGWQPWACKTNLDALERVQNKALRFITGQYVNTNCDILRAEADIPSYSSHSDQLIAKSREKAMRSAPDHPRRMALEGPTTRRLIRPAHSWRSKSALLCSKLPATSNNRKPTNYYHSPSWTRDDSVTVFADVPNMTGKSDTAENKLNASIRRIRELQSVYTIYSDGSADGGSTDGGAAAVVTTDDPTTPTTIKTIMQRGRAHTSSYEEEVAAATMAVQWIRDNCSAEDSVLICTDSQSLCSALQGSSYILGELVDTIGQCAAKITFQWIPGHADIPGNDLADAAAKAATSLDEPQAPVSYGSACALIRAQLKDAASQHRLIKAIYTTTTKKSDATLKCRKDQTLLAQLRSGHHKFLAWYQNWILPEEYDATCPLCDAPSQTLEHWFTECAGTEAARMKHFGYLTVGLDSLITRPQESVALARATLKKVEPKSQDASSTSVLLA